MDKLGPERARSPEKKVAFSIILGLIDMFFMPPLCIFAE
jgi:hypothetical protein